MRSGLLTLFALIGLYFWVNPQFAVADNDDIHTLGSREWRPGGCPNPGDMACVELK